MATDTTRIAKIMKALSNKNRLELFLEIARKQRTEFEHDGCMISDIMALFDLSAPTISHHLKELTNAGLITTERQGRFVVAKVDQATVGEVQGILTLVRGG
jgi:ArsR family transcriptional regulator, arsenate/arsenite/antimonite-responsive transcriptional repressor